MDFIFFLKSVLLGAGLAMDACAVSMANAFSEPQMKKRKMLLVAGAFGLFQGIMPLAGYFVGYAILSVIEKFIPWIALILLGVIGGKMIFEGVTKPKKEEKEIEAKELTIVGLLVQAIATSIDALSVGFTIANYTIIMAVVCVVIVAVVTFAISFVGIILGKKFGTKLGKKAELIGGIILVLIGLEIFITGII